MIDVQLVVLIVNSSYGNKHNHIVNEMELIGFIINIVTLNFEIIILN